MILPGPEMLNGDRPLVVGTSAGEGGRWSAEFASGLVGDLLAGRHEPWVMNEASQDSPEVATRFIHVPAKHGRLPHLPATEWNLLLSWRSTDAGQRFGYRRKPLHDACGMWAGPEGILRQGGPDGPMLTDPDIRRILSSAVIRIFAECLMAGRSTNAAQSGLNRLLIAIASTMPAAGPGIRDVNVAHAASRWAPAHVEAIGSQPLDMPTAKAIEMDPELERIVPRAMSISFDEEVKDGEPPIIRLDPFCAIVSTTDRMSVPEAMRTIRRGWLHP